MPAFLSSNVMENLTPEAIPSSSPADDIQVTLRSAIQTVSRLSIASEDFLFEHLRNQLNSQSQADKKAQKLAVEAIATYHHLIQLASCKKEFTEVLSAAETHVLDSLQAWSKSEYEFAQAKLHLDSPLFRSENKVREKMYKKQIAQIEFNTWILEQLLKKDDNADTDGVLAEFFSSQLENYSEEDETIKMISLFTVVYRAHGVKQYFDGKILCDVAHPIMMKEVEYDVVFLFRCLDRLAINCCCFVDYLKRLESNPEVDCEEAKELMRVYAMRLWKSLRCFKLAAFTSKVMIEIMQMPTYAGEDMWTHPSSKNWTLGVRLRDSPVVEAITIGVIVTIGLLCTPTPLAKILLTPDVFLIKRAVTMLTDFTEQHRPVDINATDNTTISNYIEEEGKVHQSM